jgi:hypothetical protein
MTIHKAIRELRGSESQQAFSSRLGMSIRALTRYEKDRMPELKPLYILIVEAKRIKRQDLARVLIHAFNEQIGYKVVE